MLHTILVLLMIVAPARSEWAAVATQDTTQILAFPEGGTTRKIVVDNISGSVRVSGYSGNTVKVDIHRKSFGDDNASLAEGMRKIRLDIRSEPGTIILYVDTPWRCRNGGYNDPGQARFDADFDFSITIPYNTDIFLKTVNQGVISVTGVKGAYEVRNVNGGIDMKDIEGAGVMRVQDHQRLD
jgi:hypothetical protein